MIEALRATLRSTFRISVLLAACSLPVWAGQSPTEPVQQAGTQGFHERNVALAKAKKYDLIMVGDSITNNLIQPAFKSIWEKFYAPRNALNLGISGARTENILWNLQNGELTGQTPKVFTLLIGANNVDDVNFPFPHTSEQIYQGTEAIIKELRKQSPSSKILLIRTFIRKDMPQRGNAANRLAATQNMMNFLPKLADNKDIYYLDFNYLFLNLDGSINTTLMPDQLHPSPAGAEMWAKAMEPTLSNLMGDQPVDVLSQNSAVVPVPKLEQDSYDWYQRHNDVLAMRSTNPEIVMIGDSITHFWGGQPGNRANGPISWKETFGSKRVLNMGFGWDRTQNVAWRLDNGEMDGTSPKYVVINIGTNNNSPGHARVNTPEEIVEGICEIVKRIRAKSPTSRIVLMGVLPRTGLHDTIKQTNSLLEAKVKGVNGLLFLDLRKEYTQSNGELIPGMMFDGCHPSEKGYAIWGKALTKLLK